MSEGHPDKIADQISDAVLDAILEQDPNARVACETMVKTGVAIVSGEITTDAWVDIEDLTRKVILGIGYDSSEVGFDGATCGVLNLIGKQSPDINRGVDRKIPRAGRRRPGPDVRLCMQRDARADAGTDLLLAPPGRAAGRIRKSKNSPLPWLRPDAKSQVTLRYENGNIAGVDAVVLSTQHDPASSARTFWTASTSISSSRCCRPNG